MAKARGNQNAPQTSYTRPRRPPNPMMDARYWTTTPPPGYRPQRVPLTESFANAVDDVFSQNPSRKPHVSLMQNTADTLGDLFSFWRNPVRGANEETGTPPQSPRTGWQGPRTPRTGWQGPPTPTPFVGPRTPNDAMDTKRQGVGVAYQQPRSMAPQGPRTPQPEDASPFVNPMGGRVPMSPLARNAQPQDNSFMDEQEAAMADQGLIDQLDAQTRQMQVANLRVPGSPGVSPYAAQDEAMRLQEVQGRRTGQFLDDNPMAGSSTDARRMNRSIPGDIYNQQTAGASNRYEGNVAYANDQYRYNPMDPRMQAIQQRNAEDQTAGRPVGRDNRWSSGAMDDYTASGGKPWYEREAEAEANSPEVLAGREQAYQNAMAQERPEAKLAKYNEREARIKELEANRQASMPPGEYDKLKAKQVDFAAKKAAEHEAFKAANGGMNYAQARREKKQVSREDGRFKRDVRRGMNPMSPGAFAAHPEAGARFRNAYAQAGKGASKVQNPMVQAFEPGARDTPESTVAKAGVREGLVKSPTMAAIGYDPGGDASDFLWSIAAYDGELSDEGMTDILSAVRSFESKDGKSPFTGAGSGMMDPQLLEELWGLNTDTPPAKVRDWHNRFKKSVREKATHATSNSLVPPEQRAWWDNL